MTARLDLPADFERLAGLAENDPAAFETLRRDAIEAYIASVPPANRERLRRLQWRIDQERRLARTPLGACVRISRMMWDNVLGEGGLRDRFLEISALLRGEEGRPVPEPERARVLPFPGSH
jgi:hypothetical protein